MENLFGAQAPSSGGVLDHKLPLRVDVNSPPDAFFPPTDPLTERRTATAVVIEAKPPTIRIQRGFQESPRPGMGDLLPSGGRRRTVIQTGHPPGRVGPPQVDSASRHRHRAGPLHQHSPHLVIPDQEVVGPLQRDLPTQRFGCLPARQQGQQAPPAHRPSGFTGHRDRYRPRSADPFPIPPSPTMFLAVRYHDNRSSPISSAGVVLCGTGNGQPNQPIWCSQRAIPQVQVAASLSKR